MRHKIGIADVEPNWGKSWGFLMSCEADIAKDFGVVNAHMAQFFCAPKPLFTVAQLLQVVA